MDVKVHRVYDKAVVNSLETESNLIFGSFFAEIERGSWGAWGSGDWTQK
jgi:hypothetical protein